MILTWNTTYINMILTWNINMIIFQDCSLPLETFFFCIIITTVAKLIPEKYQRCISFLSMYILTNIFCWIFCRSPCHRASDIKWCYHYLHKNIFPITAWFISLISHQFAIIIIHPFIHCLYWFSYWGSQGNWSQSQLSLG